MKTEKKATSCENNLLGTVLQKSLPKTFANSQKNTCAKVSF